MATTAIQAERRWRPPSFLEMMTRRREPPLTFEEQALWKEIDLAMRVAFDGVYLLEDVVGVNVASLMTDAGSLTTRVGTAETDIDAIQADYVGKRPAAVGKRVAWSTQSVTGSATGIVTGLATIESAIAVIESNAALHEWVTVKPGGTPGQLELFVWRNTGVADTTPIASITVRQVHWICGGT